MLLTVALCKNFAFTLRKNEISRKKRSEERDLESILRDCIVEVNIFMNKKGGKAAQSVLFSGLLNFCMFKET